MATLEEKKKYLRELDGLCGGNCHPEHRAMVEAREALRREVASDETVVQKKPSIGDLMESTVHWVNKDHAARVNGILCAIRSVGSALISSTDEAKWYGALARAIRTEVAL